MTSEAPQFITYFLKNNNKKNSDFFVFRRFVTVSTHKAFWAAAPLGPDCFRIWGCWDGLTAGNRCPRLQMQLPVLRSGGSSYEWSLVAWLPQGYSEVMWPPTCVAGQDMGTSQATLTQDTRSNFRPDLQGKSHWTVILGSRGTATETT